MIKKSKTRSPSTKKKPNIIFLLVLLIFVSFLVWRFQSVSQPQEGTVKFKSTLLDEPKVYERWQYFYIDRYSVKTTSAQVYNYGDVLELEGEISGGRIDKPKIAKVGESIFQKRLFWLRSNLKEKIFSAIPQPQASFLAGILLGIREDLPEDFKDNLIKTGTIHVVVVSGYNISVVGGFLAGLARFFPRRIAIITALFGIAFYTLLVGADPPALRAAIMGSLAFFAIFFGRQRFSLYSLILSAVIMFLFKPSIVSNISFQLSFLATTGIILFHERIFSLFKRLPNPLNGDLATTLSAQILVIPVIFYHFGSVSVISPLVNSLVLWVIPLSTILGFIFLVVSFLIWPIAIIISWVLWALLSIFVFVADVFSKLPIAYFSFEPGNLVYLTTYYTILFGTVFYWKYVRVAKAK
jgi:competence protein ComEC